MHDSAYHIGELVMHTYSDLPNAKILEIGSLNVNGSLRDAAAPTTHYVGLDMEEGPSVDHVIAPGAEFPVEDDSFDLVMASSVFEHDARFWETFIRMCRAARPGGHIYVNAPSNGTVHRYPIDCWRFYPDAGLALAEYARSQGIEIDLIESFVANRHSYIWNDFTAVFRKGPCTEAMNTEFVYARFPSTNARTWQSGDLHNQSDDTEDMTLIAELRAHAANLEVERQRLNEKLEELQAVQNHLQSEFDAARRDFIRLEAVSEFKNQQQGEQDRMHRLMLSGVGRLQALELEPKLFASQAERLHEEWTAQQHPLSDLAKFLCTAAKGSLFASGDAGIYKEKAELHANVEKLMERLEDREASARENEEKVASLTQALTQVRAEALEYHGKAAKAIERVGILQAEKRQGERALHASVERMAGKDRQLDWFRRLYLILEKGNNGLKGLLPPTMRRDRMMKSLARSGHFNGQAYLEKYPDVAEAGMCPLEHYVLHGMAEGRFVDTQP